MSSYKTKTRVNFRSEPAVKPETVKAVLPMGTVVIKAGDSQVNGWWQVKVPSFNNQEGFITASYLEPVEEETAVPVALSNIPNLKQVHLSLKPTVDSRRTSINGRAFPLNETGMPKRDITDVNTKADSLHGIISFLNVEKSARYGPTQATTYCNIYAFDFCYLSGVYIPRVWWTNKAIADIALGKEVPVQYGVTVNEINANSLYDWFAEFGDDFGWQRLFSLDDIQQQANEGKVCIIAGQRVNLNRSGHITCVVPETTSLRAERNQKKVIRPLQSQAGLYNHNYFVGNWWSDPNKFRAFGFWAHE